MEAFFEKYQQLFSENSIRASNGECLLGARKAQKNGYGAMKYKNPFTGRWKCTTAHRLSYMIAMRQLDIGDKDVSHLCHNGLCIRTDHLSAEPHNLNCDRVRCVNRGRCKGHGAYPLCLLHLKL